MSDDFTHDFTRLRQAWDNGNPGAPTRLWLLIDDPLRCIARECMGRERHGHMLEPTALVHGACLRLVGGAQRRKKLTNKIASAVTSTAP